MEAKLKIIGKYFYELYGKDGKLREKWESENQITNQGMEYLLDGGVAGGSVYSAWYIGLYTTVTGTIANLIGTDVGTGLNVNEFTNYTGNRQTWSKTRTSRIVSNASSKADFPILGAGTIQGAFLASHATKNVAPTKLMSVDDFSTGSRVVGIGDTLRVTYQLSMVAA